MSIFNRKKRAQERRFINPSVPTTREVWVQQHALGSSEVYRHVGYPK